MNTQPVSTPNFPDAPQSFGPTGWVAAVGAALLVAGLAAFGLYWSNSGHTASPAAPQVEVAAPASTPYFSDFVDHRAWTFYVVASEEEAATLRANLAETDAIRYALGEPVLLEAVYVASSDDDAATFTAAISEGSLMHYALGLGEDRVVDLRND